MDENQFGLCTLFLIALDESLMFFLCGGGLSFDEVFYSIKYEYLINERYAPYFAVLQPLGCNAIKKVSVIVKENELKVSLSDW